MHFHIMFKFKYHAICAGLFSHLAMICEMALLDNCETSIITACSYFSEKYQNIKVFCLNNCLKNYSHWFLNGIGMSICEHLNVKKHKIS